MLVLSSHSEQSKQRKNKVKQNIRFILSHFKEPIFPRTISSRSTAYNATQFKVVYNEKEMFRFHEHSKFIVAELAYIGHHTHKIGQRIKTRR
jgi:hypothetical protein